MAQGSWWWLDHNNNININNINSDINKQQYHQQHQWRMQIHPQKITISLPNLNHRQDPRAYFLLSRPGPVYQLLTYSFPLHYINNTTSTKGYQQVTYTVSYSHLRKRNCPTLTVCLPCSFVHFILSLSKRNAKRNHEWVSEWANDKVRIMSDRLQFTVYSLQFAVYSSTVSYSAGMVQCRYLREVSVYAIDPWRNSQWQTQKP